MNLPPFLQIGDYLISTDVISECFVCDYATCRGACCIVGESGAPVNVLKDLPSYPVDDECVELRSKYDLFSHLMSEAGRESVDMNGFSTIDIAGDEVTPLIRLQEGSAAEGTRDAECVFCHFDGDNCLCSIEKAGLSKPISCSLYPIRVRRLSSGMWSLNLHRWEICKCAFALGRKKGTRVYEFLKIPLIRAFGQDFYDALDAFRRQFAED